jgi:hypothetical protein
MVRVARYYTCVCGGTVDRRLSRGFYGEEKTQGFGVKVWRKETTCET